MPPKLGLQLELHQMRNESVPVVRAPSSYIDDDDTTLIELLIGFTVATGGPNRSYISLDTMLPCDVMRVQSCLFATSGQEVVDPAPFLIGSERGVVQISLKGVVAAEIIRYLSQLMQEYGLA